MTAFEEMGVLPEIGKAVAEMEWTLPTDVQAEAIPLILGGGDVLMAAETGSGKTGAFCLPILQTVWETLKELKDGSARGQTAASASSCKWALSTYDRGTALAITPDGLRCQSREQKEWHGTRATKGVYGKGKLYFEAIVADEGLCRIGWSTQQAVLDLGTDRFSFGFGGTGKKSHNKNFDDYGGAFGKNDVIGACLDLDQYGIFFTKNGTNLGHAFSIPPQLRNEVFYPAVVLKNAEMQFNFGDEKFKHDPPAGYIAISQAPTDNVKINSIGRNTDKKPEKLTPNAPQAIIIEPSRELADQTYNQIRNFKKYLNSPSIRELLLVGGASVKDQIAMLQQGVDIIVATPGRLEDLIGSGQLALNQCRFFVLDEADGLLKDKGYGALIHRMHHQIPKMSPDGKRLQMIVCSATLHDFEVKKLADKLMHFPTWVDLKGEDAVPETVHHVVVPIDPRKDTLWHSLKQCIQTDGVHYRDNTKPGNLTAETLSEATKILKGEYCLRAIDTHKMDQAIIFCRTKLDCDNMETHMNRRGGSSSKSNPYSCVCLHADRSPQERKDNLEMFKRKNVKFLICTDVAARGIDVTGVPFMINVTLPDEKSNYVHRIGRVGRAERMGLAISLVSTVPEKVWYHGQWCPSRGKNCSNTNLTNQKGCCIWYNETQYLGDIEEHLGVTIQHVGTDINVPSDEFDGKVVYGQKRKELQSSTIYHLNQTSSSLAELTELETTAQKLYLKRYFTKTEVIGH